MALSPKQVYNLPPLAGTTVTHGAAPTQAAMPTSFAASTPTASSVPLSWAGPTGATYVVQRSTAADFSAALATIYTGANTSVTNSSGLTASTTYYYRVKAQVAGLTDSGFAALSVATAASGGGVQVFEPNQAQTSDGGTPFVGTGYKRYESFAGRDFTWNASSCEVVLYTTWADASPLANLSVFVDGAFYDTIPVTASAVGLQYYTLTGLPAPCTIRIVDSARRNQPTFSFTVFVGVRSATAPGYVTQAAPAHRLVLDGDSRYTNQNSTRPGYVGLSTAIRNRYAQADPTTRVTIRSTGGASLWSEYGQGNTSQRAAYIATYAGNFDGTVDNTILLEMGRNDYGVENKTASEFSVYYNSFVQDLHAANPALIIKQQLLFPDFDSAGTANITAYNQVYTDADTAYSWLSLVAVADLVSNGDYSSDGIHFKSTEQEGVGNRLYGRLSGDATTYALTPDFFPAGSTFDTDEVGVRVSVVPMSGYFSDASFGGQIALSNSGLIGDRLVSFYINSDHLTLNYHLDTNGGVNELLVNDVPLQEFSTKSTTGANVPPLSDTNPSGNPPLVVSFGSKAIRKISYRAKAGGSPSPQYIWFFKASC